MESVDTFLDTRPDRPGFRLHRLEVFNWGTFDSSDGGVFRFEPEGRTSLLVGHNGSGKSTLVDALLTLLVDSRTRNYNVAAGARKTERTARSYIKGAYDRTSDQSQSSVVKYLRPQGNHLSALSALFLDERLDKCFTLTQVLYLKSDGSDDKVFAMADQPRELALDLAGLHKSDQVREHLKQRGYRTTRAYSEYLGWLTKRTRMRGKAIDMFNQTVAVKDIQSLNAFIRGHMLEAHDWRDKVQRLLTHFNDLSLAHQELVRARRSEELLAPVEKLGRRYRELAETTSRLQAQLDASRSFFPLRLVELFEPEIARQREEVESMAAVIERQDGELKEIRETLRRLRNEIDLAGGDRLRQIPDLIKVQEAHLLHKQSAFDRYRENLDTCRIEQVVEGADAFRRVRDELVRSAESSSERITALGERYEEAIGRKASVERELGIERDELEVLAKRRTNLPGRFAAMRAGICADLNLDESVLPFAAELVSVLPVERRWEASIELVLRPFALSLLVPDRYYARVRAYVERNRLRDARGEGQRLDYVRVGKATEPSGDRIHPKSLFHKLRFKARHDLSPWVRGEVLRRFDFRCCESVEEFNEVSRFAMTENRHFKFGSERHQKDDRERSADPRHFVLGWDNTEKKRLIVERIRRLESDRAALHESAARLGREIEESRGANRAALAALTVTDFDSIDVERHRVEIDVLRQEKKQLEESNDAVQALRKRLTDAERHELAVSGERDERLRRKAQLEHEIESVVVAVEVARGEVRAQREAGRFESHQGLFAAITESLGQPPLSVQDIMPRSKQWENETRGRIEDLGEPLRQQGDKMVAAMARYLREFKEDTDDLDASVHSLESFLGLLDRVRGEDLPRHEKKFKSRLNDQVSQEVAIFNTELRQERKEIEDKIAQLNKALADVEYSRGTFMRLEPRPVQDREIDEFRRSLRECLDDSLEHTDEANEARFLRIQSLVERLSDKERATWRNKVIDVRNWYDFAAQEIERESGETRSCYDGSSGQSGGEKAKLAFTILVAALAYQFDVDPSGDTPGRFQFVVVDEMFSKVDDQNAQYALKLFRQFGLQLLIVAPLDAKARVTEPFVDRYLHVVKDASTSRSRVYSMTAREYDEVVHRCSGNGGIRVG